jgi:hypothetical protein
MTDDEGAAKRCASWTGYSSPGDKAGPGEPDRGRNDKHQEQDRNCKADIHGRITRCAGSAFPVNRSDIRLTAPTWSRYAWCTEGLWLLDVSAEIKGARRAWPPGSLVVSIR